MRKHWLGLLVLSALLLPAHVAAAEDWQIARTAGTVWILKAGEEPRLAAAGEMFPNTATIATSPDGGAVLTRGEESVAIGGESVLALIQRGGRSTILMAAGAVVLDVERSSRSFTVETPFLTATLATTRFAVRVGNGLAAVDVGSGAVDVTALGSGEHAEITAGLGARVVGEEPSLIVVGGQPEIGEGRPRESRVPTLGSLMVASLVLDFAPAGGAPAAAAN